VGMRRLGILCVILSAYHEEEEEDVKRGGGGTAHTSEIDKTDK
jgi:hypothetical protein